MYRHERGPINAFLSAESKRTRKQTREIGIRISLIAWSIEFISGGLIILDETLGISKNGTLYMITAAIDLLFCSILIPCTYIINSEKVKHRLITEGCRRSLRRAMPFGRNRVSNVEVLNMDVLPNVPPTGAVLRPRTPSISENIADDK